MADEINEVSTRRGIDVRDLTLVAGGGAGPVHAAFIADILSLPSVIVPSVAATYSAFGMFAMDVGRNYARSYITRAVDLDAARVQALYEDMEQEAISGFEQMGYQAADVSFARTADLRYIGQFHEVEVAVPVYDPAIRVPRRLAILRRPADHILLVVRRSNGPLGQARGHQRSRGSVKSRGTWFN